MSNLREMYYELRCLDCGNDGSDEFQVRVRLEETHGLSGKGEFAGSSGDCEMTRILWPTLTCANCGSTNVQRKRRYRREQS